MRETIKSFGKVGNKSSKNFSLSTDFFHSSIIGIRQYCALRPCIWPHWNFENFWMIWIWLKNASFVNFGDIWPDTYHPVIFHWTFWAFLYIGVIFANFSDVGKVQTSIMLLKLWCIKLENISEFLFGISSSCDAFEILFLSL